MTSIEIQKTELLHKEGNIEFVNYHVQLPSGKLAEEAVVRHPGSVAIVPLLEDGQVVLVRQYRFSMGDYLLELPAGTREEGETIQETAQRELQEEAGYFPSSLIELEGFYVAPGITDEYMHLFIARDLRVSRLQADEDEIIEVVTMPIERALNMISTNEIRDAKTIIGLLRVTSAF